MKNTVLIIFYYQKLPMFSEDHFQVIRLQTSYSTTMSICYATFATT